MDEDEEIVGRSGTNYARRPRKTDRHGNTDRSGIRYADAGKRILLDWGTLPHLMRAGRAEVSLALADGDWTVWALAPTGRRLRAVPAVRRDGRLAFTADVAADPAHATYLYELVRE